MSDTIPFVNSLSPVGRITPAPSAVDRLKACYFYVGGVLAALAAAAVLVATHAEAQTTGPAVLANAAAPDADKSPPRYGASDIERAFNFMDTNKDSKISRGEAAGFRNVAKHFDAADSDKNGTLSLAEFGHALNRP